MDNFESALRRIEARTVSALGLPPHENPQEQISALVAAVWDESLHPRGKDGKFISKGGFIKGMIRWVKETSGKSNPRSPGKKQRSNRAKVVGFSSGDGATSADPWVQVEYVGDDPDMQGLVGYARASEISEATPEKARLNMPSGVETDDISPGQSETAAEQLRLRVHPQGGDSDGAGPEPADTSAFTEASVRDREAQRAAAAWESYIPTRDNEDDDDVEMAVSEMTFEYTASDGRVYEVSTDFSLAEFRYGEGEVEHSGSATIRIDNAGTGQPEYLTLTEVHGDTLEDMKARTDEWFGAMMERLDETGSMWGSDTSPRVNAQGLPFVDDDGTTKYSNYAKWRVADRTHSSRTPSAETERSRYSTGSEPGDVVRDMSSTSFEVNDRGDSYEFTVTGTATRSESTGRTTADAVTITVRDRYGSESTATLNGLSSRSTLEAQALVDTWVAQKKQEAMRHRVASFASTNDEFTPPDGPILDSRGYPAPVAETWMDPDAHPLGERTNDLMASMEQIEPQITDILTRTVEPVGGRMEGLQYRFKAADGVASKGDRKARSTGRTPDEELSRMSDALRYTAVVDAESYTDAVNNAIQELRDNGFIVEEADIENNWQKGDAYNGINAVFSDPRTGARVELQFHTPDSLEAKTLTHLDYEIVRDSLGTREERDAANQRMVAVADSIDFPPGIEGVGAIRFKEIRPAEGESLGDIPEALFPSVPTRLINKGDVLLLGGVPVTVTDFKTRVVGGEVQWQVNGGEWQTGLVPVPTDFRPKKT